MTTAITGATGQLGRIIISKLKKRIPSDQVVALVRSPAKAADFGVEVRAFDYSKPDSLAPALAGVDTILLISASEIGQRAQQHRHVIEAVKRSGIGRIIYTSLLHAETSPLSLAVEHRATEADLKSSGIPYTILRNGWYTENHTNSIGGALAAGAVIGSAGDGKFSTATRADYAEAAVVTVTGKGYDGKTFELAGDEAHTLTDLAAEISRQSGGTIGYRNLPEADYTAALAGFGLPEAIAKAIASWDVEASKGALFDDSRQLSTLIGRPTTPLSAAVSEALASAPKS